MAEMLRTQTLTLTHSPAGQWNNFEKQVRTYEKALYHFAYRLTGDANDAQDLLQEALLKAYRSYHRFEQGTSFDRWMFQIIYRLFIDQYRKKRRRPFISSLDEPHPHFEQEKTTEVPDYSNLPEDSTLRRELGTIIQQALMRLPENFRVAVVLCDVQGLSYEEISQVLQCSLGTVRSRIHRGRRLLRELLQPYFREERGKQE